MAEDKKNQQGGGGGGEPGAIPVATSFAETVRDAARSFVLLARGAAFVKVPVRPLNANERAAIDAEHADPFPPRKFNAQGAPYLDIYDKDYRRACDEKALLRLKARVAAMMPDDFIGAKTREEKVRIIWSAWSEADILTYDRQGTNPYETREEGVQAAEEKHSPFVSDETAASDA